MVKLIWRNVGLTAVMVMGMGVLLSSCFHKTSSISYRQLYHVVGEGRGDFRGTSSNLDVSFFVDGTYSMKGFIKDEAPSVYMQTLTKLENAAIRSWKVNRIDYFRFGTKLEIINRNTFLLAGKKEFYMDPEFLQRTNIQYVLDSILTWPSNGLHIVITDLFENNSDINILAEKVKSIIKEKNYCLGVIAIKSQFSGRVYDITEENYSFDYPSKSGMEVYRPFYVLCFGKYGDIVQFYDNLQSAFLESLSDQMFHFIIFSPHSLFPAPTLRSSRLSTPRNLALSECDDQYLDTQLKEFRVIDHNDTASFEARIPLHYLVHTDSRVSENAGSNVAIYECISDSNWYQTSLSSDFMNVKATVSGDTTLILRVNLNPEYLTKDSLYFCQIDISPTHTDLPSWVMSWNMSVEHVEDWLKDRSTFDGSTTYNLTALLGTISDLYCRKWVQVGFLIKKD